MKRFYKKVSAEKENEDFFILLDGKRVKTPAENYLHTPHQKLADAVIQEWDDQGQEINAKSMVITQFLNVEVDLAQPGARRRELEAAVLEYINSDLICYEADGPESLCARQASAWSPIRQIFEEESGISLKVTKSIAYTDQHPDLKSYGEKYLDGLTPPEFTGFQALVGPLGSFFIAKAFIEGHITVDEAFEAAMVDELHQAELWGEDEDAMKKRESLRQELRNVENYLDLAA